MVALFSQCTSHAIHTVHLHLSVTAICDKERKLMASVALLFVVILTTVSKVTSLHCSDQLPSSGDDDPQKSLPYNTAWLITVPS